MAIKVKPWVWIVVGLIVVCIVGLVVLAAFGVYFFSRHIDMEAMSASSADRAFEEVRVRFAAQKPLIELDERGRLVRTNPDRGVEHATRRPEQVHVMAFDPDDEQVVRVTIPFWLLRLKMGGATIDFNGRQMNLDDLKLSVRDLERFGPTLIVDHTSSSGERVLVWSQ